MSDPAPLQRWLAHLEAFDAADARPLADRDEMLAIARELGLDDAALAKAEADAEAARARGQAFLDHGRPADAVAALQRALALAPWRFDVLAALAEARTAAFERTGDATHRAAAEATARDLIEVDPGYGPAYALLNRLDRPMAVPVSPSRGSAGGSQAHGGRLFLALVVIVLLLAG
ncbi:MAG: hypothetical protein KC613_02190, partial [Myxococcales bacterium]|nr:hypothetical protein [Myxococcales bacterium]